MRLQLGHICEACGKVDHVSSDLRACTSEAYAVRVESGRAIHLRGKQTKSIQLEYQYGLVACGRTLTRLPPELTAPDTNVSKPSTMKSLRTDCAPYGSASGASGYKSPMLKSETVASPPTASKPVTANQRKRAMSAWERTQSNYTSAVPCEPSNTL